MIETQIQCLVVVIAVFLPPRSDSIDQDFTNPGSTSLNFDNFGLAKLAKQLAEVAEIEDKFNETEPGSSFANQFSNVTAEASTTVRDDVSTTYQDFGSTVKLAETVQIQEKVTQEQNSEIKGDLVKEDSQVELIKENKPEESNWNALSDSTEAFKVLEKRETDVIEPPGIINSTLVSSDVAVNSLQPEIFPHESKSLQSVNLQQFNSTINDLDAARKFRDIEDDISNKNSVDEKLQSDQGSLFMKNQPTLVTKPKSNRCSSCENGGKKVVPDDTSFIELGGEHEEDDTIRKFQGMIFLIDNIIETAGSTARKELGLCRKSKLADAACLLTNDEDKMEKAVLQIVSCVKDAMKDQLSSKCCLPLPRELHSFLIWLMHGSEGGGMCPPTVQEGKSKPSYLFHDDNHRPHLGGNFYGSPPPPSGATILDILSANKALPVQLKVGKPVPSRISPPADDQDQPEPMNIQPEKVNVQPENMNMQPENVNMVPENINIVPENMNMVPENMNMVPENLNIVPENMNMVPENMNVIPENMNMVPENINMVPENINMQSQFELENNPNKLNSQYLHSQQNESPYQRKLPFSGRNYYRPLRSLPDENNLRLDNGQPKNEQPEEALMISPEVGELLPSDQYDGQSRSINEFPTNENVSSDDDKFGKTIIKRDLSRRKNVSNKFRDDNVENNVVLKKKKRRDGALKSKQVSQELSDDVTSSTEYTLDVQYLLQPGGLDEGTYSKDRKEKRKERKKSKCANKEAQIDEPGKFTVLSETSNSSSKEEKVSASDLKKENNEQLKLSDSLETSSKSNDEDSVDLFDEQETNTKNTENKLKKKKRKNNKVNFSKEKHLKKMTTEMPFETGTVNMNLSDLLPSVDLVTGQPHKKVNCLKRKDNPHSSKCFQVSISGKKYKQNKLKPSIIFEDDLADTNMEIEEEEYLEPEFAVNNAEYENESYTDDENDPIEFYLDNNKVGSKSRSNSVDKTNLKKKCRDTKLKNFKGQKNRRKKKKKLSNRKNDKNQSAKSQTTVTPKSVSSVTRGGITDSSTSATSGYVATIDMEKVTPSNVRVMALSTTSVYYNVEDIKNSQDKPSCEKTKLDTKEDNIEMTKQPIDNDKYRHKPPESGQRQEESENTNAKTEKTISEKPNVQSSPASEEKQNEKEENKSEVKPSKKLTSESDEEKADKGEKAEKGSGDQTEVKQNRKFDNEISKNESTEDKKVNKADITTEGTQSINYVSKPDETESDKSEVTLKEKRIQDKTSDVEKSKETSNSYSISENKETSGPKDVLKSKFFKNEIEKNFESKIKAISKSKETKFKNYQRPRVRVRGKQKSHVTFDQDEDNIIVSKARNKKKEEEEEEEEEDDAEEDESSNDGNSETHEDEAEEEEPDEEEMIEIKPNNQMWADENDIDAEDMSDIDEITSTNSVVNNFFSTIPIRNNTKSSKLTKEAFLKIINSPEIMTDGFPQDSLLNVSNILKGIHMIGEDIIISTPRTITEQASEEPKKEVVENTSECKMMTESTMVKLSTISTAAPPVSETTESNNSSFNTLKPSSTAKPSELTSVLTLEAGSHVHATPLAKQPTTVKSGDLNL